MPKGIRPRVNEAREFLEIAKDFKDPRELIREALSNSWDANAKRVSIRFDAMPEHGSRRKKIVVEIADNGDGMDSKPRPQVGSSEIEGFFNLGDSGKPQGSIGSKGHGTKIYYKSQGIHLITYKNGHRIEARTESPPWDTLQQGIVPTYEYDESEDASERGTTIYIDGFLAKQSEFSSVEALTKYIVWYTVAGSFGHYFGQSREMAVAIKPIDMPSEIILPFGFPFPRENTDLAKGTEHVCKLLGPSSLDCGTTEHGVHVQVDVVGALLGEDHRNIVPDTYTHMGIWFGKDFVRVERNNELIEQVFGGQYYYRAMLIFANCQQFDLTANRDNIRTDSDEYDLALKALKAFVEKVRDDPITQAYFDANKRDKDLQDQAQREKERQERIEQIKHTQKERLNRYNGRPQLHAGHLKGAPAKEPESEAETALLLQAMISSRHSGIDFVVGDYNTSRGVDLLVEKMDKGIPTVRWAELVSSLDNLFAWEHPPEGMHIVICYSLGKVNEIQKFKDGTDARLVRMQAGRYALIVGTETLDVYVLREILESKADVGDRRTKRIKCNALRLGASSEPSDQAMDRVTGNSE